MPDSTIGPEQLLQMHMAMAPARTLAAGVQLDVFSHIAAGDTDAAAVARQAGADARGMRMLLDALSGLGLLTKQGSAYGLSPVARQYLVRSSPDYLGAIMETDHLWDSWTALPQAVRTGRPPHRVEQQEKAEDFFPVLVQSLHIINREPARRAAAALLAGRPPGQRVLDIACGSGVWGIAVAEADRQAHLTAQDFPGLLPTARRYAERHGVADRFDTLAGDLKTVALPEAAFDLALLGNIVHSEGEESSRALFARLHRALRPGGRIAIMDMVPNDERAGPPYPLLFALNMLVNTTAGDTYTLAEYRAWLEVAGFTDVTPVDIGSHSPMVVATKAG